MDISQKKFSNKTRFEFGEEKLKHTVKDKSGSQSFSVEYGSIPTDSGEVEERNLWYRNVGALWALLGLFIIVQRYFELGELKGSIWFSLGVVCLIVYWAAKTAYTVIDTEKGRLYIIKNKQHDEIMNEITVRRKGQWYSWYGALSLENNPSSEIDKYKWLLEREVISEQEYQDTVNKITSHHNVELSTSEDSDQERTIN